MCCVTPECPSEWSDLTRAMCFGFVGLSCSAAEMPCVQEICSEKQIIMLCDSQSDSLYIVNESCLEHRLHVLRVLVIVISLRFVKACLAFF